MSADGHSISVSFFELAAKETLGPASEWLLRYTGDAECVLLGVASKLPVPVFLVSAVRATREVSPYEQRTESTGINAAPAMVLPPPMGFNSWNRWHCWVDEHKLKGPSRGISLRHTHTHAHTRARPTHTVLSKRLEWCALQRPPTSSSH